MTAIAPLPTILPIFPLNGILLLPGGQLPLNIFEPRYLNMVQDALGAGRMFGMVQPMEGGEQGMSGGDTTPIYPVGCCGRITTFQEQDDGRFVIGLQGVCRFRIAKELPLKDGYRRVTPDYDEFRQDLTEAPNVPIETQRLIASVKQYFEARDITADWDGIEHTSADTLVTTIAMVCPFEAHERQALLESPDLQRRARLLIAIIESSLDVADDDMVVRH